MLRRWNVCFFFFSAPFRDCRLWNEAHSVQILQCITVNSLRFLSCKSWQVTKYNILTWCVNISFVNKLLEISMSPLAFLKKSALAFMCQSPVLSYTCSMLDWGKNEPGKQWFNELYFERNVVEGYWSEMLNIKDRKKKISLCLRFYKHWS